MNNIETMFGLIKKQRDQLITIALAQTNGKKEPAAKLLNISKRTLYREIMRRTKDNE